MRDMQACSDIPFYRAGAMLSGGVPASFWWPLSRYFIQNPKEVGDMAA